VRYLTVGRPESQRRDLVLAVVLAFFSLFLAGLSLESRLAITEVLRSSILAPFIGAQNMFARSSDLSEQVAELTTEREALAARVLEGADLALENQQLRAITGLPDRRTSEFAVGEVIPGAPEAGVSHSFLFRTRDEVVPVVPAGISSPEGIVGVLRTAHRGSGLGEFWTHPDFRVGVRTPTGSATGILRSFLAAGEETMMLLEGIPFQTDIPAGTLLVTSGIGGVHPPGVPVGIVVEEAESRSGWSHSFLVEPLVRPGQVRVGLVWLLGSVLPSPDSSSD
jgi:rod shape-determining protein MreC